MAHFQDIEDKHGISFARKRLCILTKHPESILEQFKIIYKGKVSRIRAKELFTWSPTFLDPIVSEDMSDNVSIQGNHRSSEIHISEDEHDDESDVEGVAETIFGDKSPSLNVSEINKGAQESEDPFGLYDLLNKQKEAEKGTDSSSLSHPPGFTPDGFEVHNEENVVWKKEKEQIINEKTTFHESNKVEEIDLTSPDMVMAEDLVQKHINDFDETAMMLRSHGQLNEIGCFNGPVVQNISDNKGKSERW
nr:RNA-directed DNA polymerase, eukaryota [Tanacetum cinerariifolium]